MMLVVAAIVLVLGLGAGVWYINSGQFTKVPPVLAKTEQQARTRLQDAGLDVKRVKHAYSDTVKRGTVISTDPGVGERIRDNDSVTLTVSDGPQTVKVPDSRASPCSRRERCSRETGWPRAWSRESSARTCSTGS